MKMLNKILSILIILAQINLIKSEEKWLDENYLLKWKTNHLEKVITIRVEVMTKGWVGFGLSKHGKTNEVDIAIGWVDKKGQATLKDFWINELSQRSLDMSQDWSLINGENNATHTCLEFKRFYQTSDKSNDIEIFENEIEMSNIVFTYSHLEPNNEEELPEHIVNKIIYLNFFEKPEIFSPSENDIEVVDQWLNVTLAPNIEKSQCVLLRNNFSSNNQIVKFQVIAQPTFEEMKIHHHFINVYCQIEYSLEFDENLGKIFPCYDMSNKLAKLRTNCVSPIMASVLSTTPVIFPNDVALNLDVDKYPYYLLEGHFKNPSDKQVDAKFAFRIWLTKQKRKYEADYIMFISTFGLLYNTWGFIVPPKQNVFKTIAIASSYCFENNRDDFPGIFIFQVMFHSHNAIYLEFRHYRNDKLIRAIPYNNYDAYFQPIRRLKAPINFNKMDKILAICHFNSINETKSFTSPNEHCALLGYYYPAIKLNDGSLISSRISNENMLKITGLEKIDGYDTELMDNIIIRKPVEYNNTKLIDFISENKYKINDPKELEEFQISTDMIECCNSNTIKSATKPCQKISKPLGLYQSMN